VDLEEVLAEAEAVSPKLEQARNESRLPEQPDYRRADALLKRLGAEQARRHVHRIPGVFGAAAPPPPQPQEQPE